MSGELRGACIFGQSGGPTAVINASAYGVLKTALESDAITNVYGAAPVSYTHLTLPTTPYV